MLDPLGPGPGGFPWGHWQQCHGCQVPSAIFRTGLATAVSNRPTGECVCVCVIYIFVLLYAVAMAVTALAVYDRPPPRLNTVGWTLCPPWGGGVDHVVVLTSPSQPHRCSHTTTGTVLAYDIPEVHVTRSPSPLRFCTITWPVLMATPSRHCIVLGCFRVVLMYSASGIVRSGRPAGQPGDKDGPQ